MNLRNNVLTVSIALLLISPIYGFGQVTSLTLDEAIALAVRNNKEVEVARLGVNKADSRVDEAFSGALPALNVSANYARNLQVPVFFIPMGEGDALVPVRVGLNNSYQLSFQVQQVLFNTAVFTGISASRVYEDAARQSLNSVITQVIAETKRLYYSALLAGEFASITQASLDNAVATLRDIRLLFGEGLIAEFDAIRGEVAVENIRPMVTQASSNLRISISALLTHIGMPDQDSVVLVDSFSDAIIDLPGEEAMIARALEHNYQLKYLEMLQGVNREIVTIQSSDYYPTLAAYGQWTNQGQGNQFSNFLSATSSAVGLNFSMNLFNGFRTKARVEQAQADLETVRYQAALLRDGISLQVRAAMNSLKSARERILAQLKTVAQADRGVQIAQIRYREGAGSLLEINDAELALSRAKSNKAQAQYDYAAAQSELDKLTASFNPIYYKETER